MSDRPPFDPSRVRPPPSPRAADPASTPLTPTQVNELVRGAVYRHLPPTLHVVGQLANLSRPGSGHLYFSLKDHAGELRAVLWRSDAQRLKFEPRDGLEVIAIGGVEIYVPRGTYQLQVRRLEPRGVGALELAFRQMRDKLARLGYFDPARKRPLPRLPQRIALVTSPHGAAIRDILHALQRRFPAVDVLLFACRVQGEGAAAEIAESIRRVNRCAPALGGIDLAIVGRGGGSQEDLWAFNEEPVARAIFESQIPIVSAVGHEIDVTIADLVADLRAATPTAAAELTTPDRDELLVAIHQQAGRVRRSLAARLQLARSDLGRLCGSAALARPLDRVHRGGQRIDEALAHLRSSMAEMMRAARQRLSVAEMSALRRTAGRSLVQLEQAVQRRRQRLMAAFDSLRRGQLRRVEALRKRIDARRPDAELARYAESLRNLAGRLARGQQAVLQSRQRELQVRVAAVEAAHPRQALRRGFAIVRDARSRQIVRSVAELRVGRRILIELADGQTPATSDDPRQPRLFD